MDLRRGFHLETPDVFVPWDISEVELQELVPTVRKVTSGYFTVGCVSLGGLEHMLGFHFEPRRIGRLVELEFFRSSYPDVRASFEEFQRHLESAFGPPERSGSADAGFRWYEWRPEGSTVRHWVFDRFGLEEHVQIRKD